MEINEALDTVEKMLTASNSEEDEKTKFAAKIATIKYAMSDMTEEQKKEARKAIDEEMPEKKKEGKKAMGDHPEEKKKESMNHEEHDDMKKAMDEKDKEVRQLKAQVNYLSTSGIINEMMTARRNAGMPEADIKKFGESLYGKPVEKIKQRYQEDQALLARTVKEDPMASLPFNAGLSASASEKILEDLI